LFAQDYPYVQDRSFRRMHHHTASALLVVEGQPRQPR
jgi:hypothetical protein